MLTVVRPAEETRRSTLVAAWPDGDAPRQGLARIESTRRASLLDWIGWPGRQDG
jgi:hypothetical protein